MSLKISVDRQTLAEFCKRNRIKRLAFFGSVLRDDFRPDSDVDVLVEFEPGHIVGFVGLYKMEQELFRIFGGHKPDIVNPRFLNRRIKDKVLKEAQTQYAA